MLMTHVGIRNGPKHNEWTRDRDTMPRGGLGKQTERSLKKRVEATEHDKLKFEGEKVDFVCTLPSSNETRREEKWKTFPPFPLNDEVSLSKY